MEYIKTPYSILKGKTFTNRLSSSEKDQINRTISNYVPDGLSVMYGQTFQELFKEYQSGENPAESAYSAMGKLGNPENLLAIHNAINTIADEYGYEPLKIENLVGAFDTKIYKKLLASNTYTVIEPSPSSGLEASLLITDKDYNITYILLPQSTLSFSKSDVHYFITCDGNGNVLIPKKAYESNLRSV